MSLILNFSAEEVDAAKKIVINSASRILSLYDDDKKVAIYPLGLGKVSTPTPTGYYKIRTKEKNPPWIDPSSGRTIPSGPSNPLGYRWMQIQGNYGIHGTNRPGSIGHYVSNGCIRMLEKNVEELFDKVNVGTPVEITYNRVVVEKTGDGDIVYYIYPDGYRWQSLNVAKVSKWLEPFGVLPFESDENISKKIKASDGNPTYLGRPYDVELNGAIVPEVTENGRKFLSKAVIRDKISYLPAVPIAMNLKTKLEWHPESSTLKTSHGEVTGYELKKQLYINADDVSTLFGVNGGLENISEKSEGKIFRLHSAAPVPVKIEKPAPKTENPEVTPEINSELNPEVTEKISPAPEVKPEPEGEVISVEVVEEVLE